MGSLIMKVLAIIAAAGAVAAACATDERRELTSAELEFLDAASEPHGTRVATTDGDELVCKRYARTGSRVKSTVCLTEHEWDTLEERGQRSMREFSERAGGANTGVPASNDVGN